MKLYVLLFSSIFLSTLLNAQTCPNGGFESWITINNSGPDSGWNNSNVQSLVQADTLTVWSVPGYSGQAVHIQTAIFGMDSEQAWVINSIGNPMAGIGGVPYSQQPTAITGYYRYNMGTGDSAALFVGFKKSGVLFSSNTYKISNSVGSVSTFTPFTFTLNTLSLVPDTVIIGMTSSNLFSGYMAAGSWIEFDQLVFTGPGITQGIPDGSFDNWLNVPFMQPNGWNMQVGFNNTGVSQTTDHYSGSYAVQLTTSYSGNNSGNNLKAGVITNGYCPPNNGPSGGQPYSLTTDTLYGYYKYTPQGTDTASVSVTLSAAGAFIGNFNYFITSASTWTLFSIPISLTTTPDTMRIDIYSSNYSMTGMSTTVPGSVLKIDNLYLASQPLGIPGLSINKQELTVYPIPANDILNFSLDGSVQGLVEITLYDLAGRILSTTQIPQANGIISLPVGYLESGLYFYEVKNNGSITRDKFCKE